jgi:hypothetical protein
MTPNKKTAEHQLPKLDLNFINPSNVTILSSRRSSTNVVSHKPSPMKDQHILQSLR